MLRGRVLVYDNFLPRQFRKSEDNLYPFWQSHVKLPTVFKHRPFWHIPINVRHSSISIRKTNRIKANNSEVKIKKKKRKEMMKLRTDRFKKKQQKKNVKERKIRRKWHMKRKHIQKKTKKKQIKWWEWEGDRRKRRKN